VEVNIPLFDVIKQILKYAKLLKKLSMYKRKLKGDKHVRMERNSSALIYDRKLTKRLTHYVSQNWSPKPSQPRSKSSWPNEFLSMSTLTPVADSVPKCRVAPSIRIHLGSKTDFAPANLARVFDGASVTFNRLSGGKRKVQAMQCMTRSSSNNLHTFDPKIDRTLHRLRKDRSIEVGNNGSFISISNSINNNFRTDNSDFAEFSSFDINSEPNIADNTSHKLEQMENNDRTLT
ncbi:hypothetical protein CR513_03894, partial [Mucuna pruriens]